MLYQRKNPHGGDIYAGDVSLDFSANTNPFGTPPGVLGAITEILPELHRYPDPYCRHLVQAIGEFEGVPQSHVLCGNGAAELIYAYCQAVQPKLAVELAPTFSEYAQGLSRVGCDVLRYQLKAESDFALDAPFLDFLDKTAPEVVFLCNPNNPTGRLISQELLEKVLIFCCSRGIRLFVDECFLDLTDNGVSLKGMLADYENLFVLKAFTKSYGMAGIRLGYGLSADSGLLEWMSACAQPWNVSSIAQAAGIAALREGTFLEKTKKMVACERGWLKENLEALGLPVCPSDANFLLFYGEKDLHKKLKEKKIAIRNCDNYIGLGPGWYRIGVRLPEENRRLLAAIREVL